MTDENAGGPAIDRPRPRGITWSSRLLLLGALFAVPVAIVSALDEKLGIAIAIGTLPAAVIGLPPRRAGRVRYLVVAGAVALGLVLGSLLAGEALLATVVIFAAGLVAAVFSGSWRAGPLVLALGIPMIGAGLSFGSPGSAITLGLVMLAAGVWCLLLALPWPERATGARPGRPAQSPQTMLDFGIRLGLAVAIAAAVGFALQLDHVGWATAAAALVMRADPELLLSRAVGRSVSVIVGAAVGGAFMLLQPSPWLVGVVAAVALAVLTALSGSRWYVTGAFSTFLVFILLLQGDPADAQNRFWERALETLLGVTLALIFGVAVPWVAAKLRL